jgi:hypothetical protein
MNHAAEPLDLAAASTPASALPHRRNPVILAALVALGLAPGLITAVHVHRTHGPVRAALAAAGVTLALAAALLGVLLVFPPLAIACAAGCVLAALRAYDQARLTAASSWLSLAGLFAWCARWRS